MRQFKISSVPVDKKLDYDLVDMPPFDGDWVDRRYTHETIAGEPQTSLNARPRNIPRNAELMEPLDREEMYKQYRHQRRRQRQQYEDVGSFPWGVMKMHGHRYKNMQRQVRNLLDNRGQTDFIIQFLLLLNVGMLIYILLRTRN